MDKIHALLVAVIITVGFASVYSFYLEGDREAVRIVRVIDGDTVVLEDGRTVRLLNINAPEKKTFASQEATDFLERYLNKTVELEATDIEKYGRTLGRLYGPEYMNLGLVENGLASIFLVTDSERKTFYQAQQKAVQSGQGMWNHSDYFGCIDSDIDKQEEYVFFRVECNSTLVGWTIKDESTKTYTIRRAIREDFILHSGEGTDSEHERYWDAGNVWNNDRDSLFIRDKSGRLVYYESYGY